MAELLDVGFAGGIIDCRRSLGHDSGHDDVCRSRDRSLIEEHIGAAELLGFDMEYVFALLVLMNEFGAQGLETQEVGVEPASTYLVASGLGYRCLTETTEQRTDGQH